MRVIGGVLVFVLVAASVALWLLYVPLTPASSETFLDFPTGTSSSEMARELQNANVIRSRYAFLLVRLWKNGTLKAGEYRFADAASAIQVYARIQHGEVYTRAVTIPEGFNLYDIASAVQAAGLGSRDAFLQAAHSNTDLIAAISPAATSLEGYLYPDTYRFSRHTTPRAMQEAMIRRFNMETAKLGLAASPGVISRTVILASLVEKEVRFDNERALASGVFENRLARGMPLQTDPAVIYAALLANHWTGIIHRSDLDFDSPYNTYRRSGLPPGPICSPGDAAFRAALHPATTDMLYFVADSSGHTQFSSDLAEHLKKVTAYRNSLR